jgi:hypothetical protein
MHHVLYNIISIIQSHIIVLLLSYYYYHIIIIILLLSYYYYYYYYYYLCYLYQSYCVTLYALFLD